MVDITKNFTYNLADDYLAQTNNDNKTSSWTYSGPDKIWVFVNNETNLVNEYNYKTESEDGETYPTPEGFIKVLINCNENPLLGVLLNASSYSVNLNDLPQKEVNLPNGSKYVRPLNPDPNHTYEASEIQYINGEWIIPWKKPWMSWEIIYKQRDEYLKEALLTQKYVTDLPNSLKTKLQEYITSLENIETEWEGYEPYMYVFPDYPL
jgi:hypothetical protein